MKRRLMWLALLSGAIIVGALYYVGNVRATTASGFAAKTLAQGRLDHRHGGSGDGLRRG